MNRYWKRLPLLCWCVLAAWWLGWAAWPWVDGAAALVAGEAVESWAGMGDAREVRELREADAGLLELDRALTMWLAAGAQQSEATRAVSVRYGAGEWIVVLLVNLPGGGGEVVAVGHDRQLDVAVNIAVGRIAESGWGLTRGSMRGGR